MKIALIVQRYGTEVLGGSEHLCRLMAERLAALHEVDVLTTCARDYVTWKNEYQEGSDRIRGVTVRRFANAGTRDLDSFNRYSEWIYNNAHTRADEMEWLKQQGPWCPPLIDYLRRNQQQYDVLVFFTCGSQRCPRFATLEQHRGHALVRIDQSNRGIAAPEAKPLNLLLAFHVRQGDLQHRHGAIRARRRRHSRARYVVPGKRRTECE